MPLVLLTIAIRAGFGMAVGIALATLLRISGPTFAVVALCSAAPVGLMSLTFSSIARLDRDFTSRAVSVSILLGIIYVPILMGLVGVTS